MNNKDLNIFINYLSNGLRPYKFKIQENIILNDINFRFIAASPIKFGEMNIPLNHTLLGKFITSIFWRKNFFSGRYICCLIDLNENEINLLNFKSFIKKIRIYITQQYSKLRFIGTFLIFYSSNDIHEKYLIFNKKGRFVDKTGLHRNVMMSSTFINIENNKYNTYVTWGLAFAKFFYDYIIESLNKNNYIRE